jgi:TonB family protein
MKRYILLILFGFLFSSTYEVLIKLESYEGIRPGTKIIYKKWDAGKVKSISKNKDGDYTVSLMIYNEIKDIDNSFLFKLKDSKLVVDFDAMKKRAASIDKERIEKIKNEKEQKLLDIRLAKEAKESERKRLVQFELDEENKKLKLIIAEEARLAKIKNEEEARLAKIKNEEEARLAKIKNEEEARLAKIKATKEAKEKRLQLAANSSPFNGNIDKIKAFQKDNGLDVDGFWGSDSQKIYDRIENQKIKSRQLALDKENKEKELRVIEMNKKKAEAKQAALEAEKSNQEYKNEKEGKNNNVEASLIEKEYDVPPKIKRLKFNINKYKDDWPVTVKFYINKKGRAEKVSIKQSSGNSKFDSSAKTAIKKSRWVPAKKNGKSKGVWFEHEFSY